jgi:hypothetical protein
MIKKRRQNTGDLNVYKERQEKRDKIEGKKERKGKTRGRLLKLTELIKKQNIMEKGGSQLNTTEEEKERRKQKEDGWERYRDTGCEELLLSTSSS